MNTATRWVVAIAAALLVVGMIAWARGTEHQRGDDVGSLTAAQAEPPGDHDV